MNVTVINVEYNLGQVNILLDHNVYWSLSQPTRNEHKFKVVVKNGIHKNLFLKDSKVPLIYDIVKNYIIFDLYYYQKIYKIEDITIIKRNIHDNNVLNIHHDLINFDNDPKVWIVPNIKRVDNNIRYDENHLNLVNGTVYDKFDTTTSDVDDMKNNIIIFYHYHTFYNTTFNFYN